MGDPADRRRRTRLSSFDARSEVLQSARNTAHIRIRRCFITIIITRPIFKDRLAAKVFRSNGSR